MERPVRPGRDHGPQAGRALGLKVGGRGPGKRHAARAPHPPATGLPQGRPREAHAAQNQEEPEERAPPHSAAQALLGHREIQDAERARANGSWREQGLVFPNTLGTPMDYTNLVPRHFKPLLRRAGLPDIRFHDLRHTCATLLLTKGVHPKIVSEMLGHSSVSITLDVYSHVIPGLGDAAALAMEDALGDDPSVSGVGGEAG